MIFQIDQKPFDKEMRSGLHDSFHPVNGSIDPHSDHLKNGPSVGSGSWKTLHSWHREQMYELHGRMSSQIFDECPREIQMGFSLHKISSDHYTLQLTKKNLQILHGKNLFDTAITQQHNMY